MNDHLDDSGIACDWCPQLVLRGQPEPQPAQWAVGVHDCCHPGEILDLLLCDRHWKQIREQQLPGTCEQCGHVATTIDAVVATVMPIGESSLQPTPEASPRSPALRTPVEGALAPAPSGTGTVMTADSGMPVIHPVAERWWVEQREILAREDADRLYGEPLRKLDAEHRAALKAGNAGQAMLLESQQRQLRAQRDGSLRAAQATFEAERRAFALWRQTPQGRFFLQWADTTYNLVAWISDVQDRWDEAWDAATDRIPAGEREAHRTQLWIDRTIDQRRGKLVRDIGFAVTVVGILLALVISTWLGVIGVIGAGMVVYGVAAARDSDWDARNRAEGARQSEARIAYFGFDPLESDQRPTWYPSGNPLEYGSELLDMIMDGFIHHPSPTALPDPIVPELISPESVSPPEVRQVLYDVA